tara:strand:- start:10590 stop:12266 length:1677 start_codon:yes stop_codon:yes gene_type:complete
MSKGLVAFCMLLVCVLPAAWAEEATSSQDATPDTAVEASEFDQLLAPLASAGFPAKKKIAVQISQSGHPSSRAVLDAFLQRNLYLRTSDDQVVIAQESTDEPGVFELVLPADLSALGTSSKSDLKSIRTNNALRKALKGLIAQIDLNDKDVDVRLAAVTESMRNLDDATIAAFRERLSIESSDKVRRAMQTGIALSDLESSDVETRLSAIRALEGEVSTDAHNQLSQLLEQSQDGNYLEPDERVRKAASQAIAKIDFWRSIYGGIETIFFGLSLGSVLVLAAIGLAITFGVMGVINMAHGELIMLGAYTAYVMQLLLPDNTALALVLSVPAAFLVSGLFGVAIERSIVRFLYGRPLETLLATFGLSLILQQLVRSVFSPNNRPVSIPDFMSGVWQINDALSLTLNRLYILIFALLVFAALLMILKRTSLGLKVRAVSQNRAMARAMGVRASWVDAATFGLGAGIAGIAGVALSQLTNVGPNLGQAYIIDSFMVVVFGGVGNLWGTLIGGMSLGVINKLLEPAAGAVLAKILVLVALILFIQRRPSGLFPQKGRAAEGH